MNELVLITGMNGFIGQYVARRLLDEGYRVLGVSIESECLMNDSRLLYEQVDILDTKRMKEIFTRYPVGTLIHLAALVHKAGDHPSCDDYYRVNYQASEEAFRLAVEHHVKNILFASTVEVYGSPKQRVVDENSPLCPESDYAKSKKLAEEGLLRRGHDTRYAIMRFAPVYAEDFRLNIDKRIYLSYPKIAFRFRRGDYSFHFCSVHNISDFIAGWLQNRENGVFNISDPNMVTAKDFIQWEKAAGRGGFIIRMPLRLSRAGVVFVEKILRLMGRTDSMISLYNFNKLFSSIRWDNQAMQRIIPTPKWNMQNTLYADLNKGLTQNPERIARSIPKRWVDFSVAALAFLFSSPLFLLIALAIKCTSKGPVFFRQKRVGLGRSYFSIYKFRTMVQHTPNDVPTHLFKDPNRYITPLGRLLRKTSLDELPQILNVIRGEMSIVGPRPALYNQDDLVMWRDKYGANDVRPGITGWAQIHGRDELDIPTKASYDGYYIEHWSFGFDLKIIIQTIPSISGRYGIVEGSPEESISGRGVK